MAKNVNEAKVELHWVYAPVGFFDEKIVLELKGCIVEIEGGRAIAKMSADFYDSAPGLHDALTQDLNNYFLLWQPDRRKVFEIKKGGIVRIRPDGTSDTTLAVDSIVCHSSVGTPTLISIDPNGVVHDPRREHFETMKKQAELKLHHASNPTVRKMLESFDRSVREPGIELYRLYDVWETLAEAFGGKPAAGAALRISYGRLEALANDRRLRQGRHSGQQLGAQRDATAAELDEARSLVLEMIEKYLTYLDNQGPQN